LGIGDWGFGDWGLGPIPNPQSPFKLEWKTIFKLIFKKLILILNKK